MTVELGQQAEPYTVEDVLEQFPEDKRIELLEGTLIVSPFARYRHQVVGDELRLLLRNTSPTGVRAVTNVDLRLDPRTLLVPDVMVTTVDLSTDPVFVDPADVLAAVEVVSPWSGSYVRLLKPDRYAAAGIGCYWRVELDPFPGQGDDALPVVLVPELVEGTYQERTRLVAGAVGETDLPFPVSVDPADLVR